MTSKMTTQTVFSNQQEIMKSEWNSFGVGLAQAFCQGSVTTDISFCKHFQFCFAKQSCGEQFIMKMHVFLWNQRLIAVFPFLRDNSKWNCLHYQRARIFIKRDYFFATIGKLHADFLHVSKALEITLCWWLKLCQWVELISTRFMVILICRWSDLQKVNTAFHNETNKKSCKPRFTQIVRAIDFAKAGFHLRCCIGNIQFSISNLYLMLRRKISRPGRIVWNTNYNLHNIFDALFRRIQNTALGTSRDSWFRVFFKAF